MENSELSLYLHIPFCTEKCDYCDFYSVPLAKGEQERFIGRYVEALLAETDRRLKEEAGAGGYTIPSLYIGGGTPSLLGADIAGLLGGLRPLTGAPGEITVEANPETADSAFLRACADYGVTRLSLGIQSFNEGARKAAGRKGWSGPALFRRISEAADMFGQGLSLDLISGLPGQDEEVLRQDIHRALSYNPGHISLYALTVEEGTPLAQNVNRKGQTGRTIPAGEAADQLWLAGRDALIQAGFDQYEVSNFAKSSLGKDRRCVHNIRYWRMNNWLGIGPGASGTIIGGGGTGRRITYHPDVGAFCLQNRAPRVIIEELDRATVVKETLLMGYRYCEGPDPALFLSRFGKTIEETIPQTLAAWQNRAGNGSLQETIMNFLNSFLLDAFSEFGS